MTTNKMPRVSVYVTPEELKKVVEMYGDLEQISPPNEKCIAIKVEGTINYHHLQELLSKQQEDMLAVIEGKAKALLIQQMSQDYYSGVIDLRREILGKTDTGKNHSN